MNRQDAGDARPAGVASVTTVLGVVGLNRQDAGSPSSDSQCLPFTWAGLAARPPSARAFSDDRDRCSAEGNRPANPATVEGRKELI